MAVIIKTVRVKRLVRPSLTPITPIFFIKKTSAQVLKASMKIMSKRKIYAVYVMAKR